MEQACVLRLPDVGKIPAYLIERKWVKNVKKRTSHTHLLIAILAGIAQNLSVPYIAFKVTFGSGEYIMEISITPIRLGFSSHTIVPGTSPSRFLITITFSGQIETQSPHPRHNSGSYTHTSSCIFLAPNTHRVIQSVQELHRESSVSAI